MDRATRQLRRLFQGRFGADNRDLPDEGLPWEEGHTMAAPYEETREFWQQHTLSAQNIHEISFMSMLKQLEPLVLEPVPEGTQGTDEALAVVDLMLGRLANTYTFLTHAWALAGFHAGRFKAMGDEARFKDCVLKRETLYRLARAVEFKYQAASRMLTLHIEENEDLPERVDVRRRAGRAEGIFAELRPAPRPGRGSWDDV